MASHKAGTIVFKTPPELLGRLRALARGTSLFPSQVARRDVMRYYELLDQRSAEHRNRLTLVDRERVADIVRANLWLAEIFSRSPTVLASLVAGADPTLAKIIEEEWEPLDVLAVLDCVERETNDDTSDQDPAEDRPGA